MMNNRFTWLAALILSHIIISGAQGATPIEEALQTFTECNGEFFYSIKNNKGSISKIAPLTENEKSASFAVENRAISGKNAANFSNSVDVFGLHLLGYFDEVTSITPKEQYYYWGFFVAESPDVVRTRLENYIKNHERLRKEEGAFARLEMHDGKSWVAIESPQQFSGKTPGSYVERVFLIEKSDNDRFPGTRLSCSIQGPVTDIAIADSRPDLPSKDYPIRPKYSGMDFDSVPIEPKVQRIADTLLKNENLKPKFKSASLKYRISRKGTDAGKSDYFLLETYQVTQNGLIKKREIYSPTFFVDRLLLWNLVQLKSKMSSSEVYLTREINVKTPESLSPGQALETEVVSGDESSKRIFKNVCTFGDKFQANEINKLLTGFARKVSCINLIEGTSEEYAFLDEMGLLIHRSGVGKNKSESVYELIDFNSNILEEDRLVMLASKTNETLPRMIDQYTRLDSTAGTVNTFHSNYTLVNHTGASGKKIKKALEDGVVKNMCTSKDMLDVFIRKKVTVIFSYYGNDKVEITEFSVSPSQCFVWQQL
jgi:hypothetical protein